MANKEQLFSEFQAPTRQEWLDKIQVDLKGADFQKKLVWRTNEGFSVQPFYRREDLEGLPAVDSLPGEFPFVRGNKKSDNLWYVRQDIDASDPAAANAKALDLLNKGVDSLCFGFSPRQCTADTIATLLKGIYPEAVELNFRTCQRAGVLLPELLTSYFKSTGAKLDQLHGSIAFDPFEKMLHAGFDTTPVINLAGKYVEDLRELPLFRCLNVDSVSLGDAGAYIYQELGYALAWGNEWLQLLTEQGFSVDEVASRVKFNMGVSDNYFMEIAKFRAARLLWAQIVKQYEPASDAACQMHVCARTSSYNQTVFDSYVNLLRSQTEAMSAALGNVDSIVVTPFDAPYKPADDFSERLARNQQLLLKEEAHFDKLVDVGGGSYYIEHLTDAIAQQAWKLFLEVEADGGFLAQCLAGKVQEAVNASNAKRHGDAAKRKEFMLGTNQFPNFNEKSEGKVPIELQDGACDNHGHHAQTIPTLDRSRMASEFEQLRLQTEAAQKQPIAFMLTIGNLAMRQARAQFSCNFLACAGYKVIDNLGFKTVEEGVDAALKAGADIVVICSSDDEYAEYAIPAFQYLDGRAMYVVAGAPACSEDLKAAGIEHFIHVRVNQLETLKQFNALLLRHVL